MNIFCPKCYSKLKIKTRENEDLGFVGELHCPSCYLYFEHPNIISWTMCSETRTDARKDIIDEFNKKYNPSQSKVSRMSIK